MKSPLLGLLCGLALASTGAAAREVALSPRGLVPLPGVEARLVSPVPPTVSFAKTGPERRLVAASVDPIDLSWARSLHLFGSLTGTVGRARLAVVVRSGPNTWYRFGPELQPSPTISGAVSLDRWYAAAFSADRTAAPDLASPDELWLGLVLDGPASGQVSVLSATISDEPLVASRPAHLPLDRLAGFDFSRDQALAASAKVMPEGPGGAPAVRLDLDFADQRHLYGALYGPLSLGEMGAYRSIRMTYRTELPNGPSMLFGLSEPGGGQYIPPQLPLAPDWRTETMSLSSFTLAPWSQSSKPSLDLDKDLLLTVGAHGAANPIGTGTIWISEVTLVP